MKRFYTSPWPGQRLAVIDRETGEAVAKHHVPSEAHREAIRLNRASGIHTAFV